MSDPAPQTSSVQVAVRVRPFNKREIKNGSKLIVRMKGSQTVLLSPDQADKALDDVSDADKRVFTYDYSYWSFDDRQKWPGAEEGMATQDTVFEDMGKVILNNAYDGFNCTLMAYGQTGSGKSYSMMGAGSPESAGLIPRICNALFRKQQDEKDENLKYHIEVSYLEIYSERIQDLLNPKKVKSKSGLKVREHPETGPYVQDLTTCAVKSYEELETLMEVGNKERTVAATNMNSVSSRSHAVFSIVFTTSRFDEMTQMSTDKVSKIRLVDLAGSERVETSGVSGIGLKEAANINKSLTTLGRVISALAKASGDDENAGKKGKKKKTFVPFRDSVLTWLLKDSLGGNSKTIMIAALSPADINYDETLSTLRYASRAKKIVNKAVINEDPNAKIIRSLQEEIEQLRSKLASGGSADGTVSPEDSKKVVEMEQELEESRKLIEEMKRSWEEKLKESHELAQKRVAELEEQGLGLKGDDKHPFLVSLCEDPSMSKLMYYLKEGKTLVGRIKPEDDASIQFIKLSGIGLKKQHCYLHNEKGSVYIEPYDVKQMADIYLNGEIILTKREVYHGDRLILGQNHIFRFSHAIEEKQVLRAPVSKRQRASVMIPNDKRRASLGGMKKSLSLTHGVSAKPAGAVGSVDDSLFDWDFATRERVVAQGKLAKILPGSRGEADVMVGRLKALEEEKDLHAAELKKQKEEYAKLLKKMEAEQNGENDETAQREELAERLMKLLPMIDEANAICKEMNKAVLFEVELAAYEHAMLGQKKEARHLKRKNSFSAHLVPLERIRQPRDLQIQIKVIRGRTKEEQNANRFSIWTPDMFEDRLASLRVLYNTFMDEESIEDMEDPLAFDKNQLETQLIGTAHIYLAPLLYGEGIQYNAPIIDHRGDYAGLLTIQIYCNPDEIEEWGKNLHDDDDVDADDNSNINKDEQNDTANDGTTTKKLKPKLGGARMLKREKTAGRFLVDNKVHSHVPVEGQHLPIILRISQADRIPSSGIRFLEVKYRFGENAEIFSTNMAEVTSEFHQKLSIQTGNDSKIISRKRSDRLSHPVDFDYVMRHDIPGEEVTKRLLKWLRHDAITFEVWGRFYTGETAAPANRVTFDLQSENVPEKKSNKEVNEINLNTVFVAVDVEEKGPSGNFDACMMKESIVQQDNQSDNKENNDLPATFRITSGLEHEKRFVITIIQVDSTEFILESVYKAEVTAIKSQSILESMDNDTEISDETRDHHGLATLSNVGDPGMPLDLKVWEQYYQINNKLITVVAEWSPEMSQKLLLRRPSSPGERIMVHLKLKAFVSRQTDPIEFTAVVALKAYDPTKTVSKVRSFFSTAHASQGRLHAIGAYYNILKVKAEAGVHDLFEEHHSRMWKMQHAMRIDHIQQNLTLIKVLQANESDQFKLAERAFTKEMQLVEELEARDAEEDAKRMQESLKTAGQTEKTVWKLVAKRTFEEMWIKSGFLYKSGKVNTKWKRRWFTLKPPFLFYYKRPHDEEPKGAIDLIGVKVRVLKDADQANSFEIHSQTRAWYLRSDNEEEMNNWISGVLEFNDPDSDEED